MADLTGRTRARIDWRGRVILQVEVAEPLTGRAYPSPPRCGEADQRLRRLVWRDALQADLLRLQPPTVAAASPSVEPASR